MNNAERSTQNSCQRDFFKPAALALLITALTLLNGCADRGDKFKLTHPIASLLGAKKNQGDYDPSHPDLCAIDHKDQNKLIRANSNKKIQVLDSLVDENDVAALAYLSDAHTKFTRYHPLGDVALSTPLVLDLQSEQSQQPIWPLIRAQFRLQQTAKARNLSQETQWFKQNSSYVERSLTRGAPYLSLILDEVRQRQLPGELLLIPVIESAYDPFAYAPGGAAGIWQFVPGTASHLGLKRNAWYDGRRDVVASTRTALSYFETLNKTFNGNWLYTLAAYNAGSATVEQAIQSNRRRGRSTDFWSLPLPRHTQNYVARLLALSQIVDTPKLYGMNLPPISSAPQLALVKIKGQIDLAQAASSAGISMNQLYRYNPGFSRWKSDPSGPFYLLIPYPKAGQFAQSTQQIRPQNLTKAGSQPNNLPHKQILHQVKKGEGLSVIAQHYGVKIQQLAAWNDLSTNAPLRIGQKLKVLSAR
ncbi:MAG TPA: transglycosylase SLT domain-containing protein [Pseudomonadales bacterium]|nr:transglycosylase SLT domain-containing protein [Pseudomonadales bacterium]